MQPPRAPEYILEGPGYSFGVLPNEAVNDGSYYLVATQAQRFADVFKKPAPDDLWAVPKYIHFEHGVGLAQKFSATIAAHKGIAPPAVHVLVNASNMEEEAEPYAFTADTTWFEAFCMKAEREATKPTSLESDVQHEENMRRLHLVSPQHAALGTDLVKEHAALHLYSHDHKQWMAVTEDWSPDEYSFSLASSLTPENMFDPLIAEAIGQQTAARCVMRLLVPAMRRDEPMTPELAHECLIKGAGAYAVFCHGIASLGSARFDEIAQMVIMHSPKYGPDFSTAYGEIEGVVLALDRSVFGDDTPPAPPGLLGKPAPRRT